MKPAGKKYSQSRGGFFTQPSAVHLRWSIFIHWLTPVFTSVIKSGETGGDWCTRIIHGQNKRPQILIGLSAKRETFSQVLSSQHTETSSHDSKD